MLLRLASAALLALVPPAQAQGLVQKLIAPDRRALDLFGSSVALHGERALIGAQLTDDVCGGETGCQSGSAYVFVRREGRFVFSEELHASHARRQDHFGSVVGLAAELAVVATTENLYAPERLSCVYVFERRGDSWLEVERLHAPDQEPEDGFGSSLATDGERIVVGSPGDDLLGFTETGSVWIFERAGGTWQATTRLTATVPDQRMHFGTALALDGDRLLVGAPSDAHSGDYSGSAFVFRQEGGAWIAEQRLVASDAEWYASFGAAVALEGDIAVISAKGDDTVSFDGGAVYVFERSLHGWSERAQLQPHDTTDGLRFGWSVGISGRTIAVASPLADDVGLANGALWIFRESPQRWREIARLRPRDNVAGDFLGQALVFEDELVLASASAVDHDGASSVGAAYLFQVPAFATSFCACASGAPCGNEAALGGCANSSGSGAELAALGSSALGPLELELLAAGLPAGALGVLCAGPPSARLPFGDGWRCVGLVEGRFLRAATARASASGALALGPADLSALEPLVRPGSSWVLQLAFDDPRGPCGGGSNTSNALLVQF